MWSSKFALVAIVALIQVAAVLAKTKLLTGGTIVADNEEMQLLKVIRGGALLVQDDRTDQIID
jgi:hypothetical protein